MTAHPKSSTPESVTGERCPAAVPPAPDTCLTLLIVLALVLTAAVLRMAPWHDRPMAPPAAVATIDPNTAPWWELAALPGIGETLARRIVRFRESASGAKPGVDSPPAFAGAHDLTAVRGLGPKKVERIGPFLRFAE